MLKHIHFQTIGVSDMDRAVGFYRDKLDLTVERDNPYGDSRWIFMALPEGKTLLHFEQRAKIEPSDKPVLVFVTEDVDATCETLKARGVTIDRRAIASNLMVGGRLLGAGTDCPSLRTDA